MSQNTLILFATYLCPTHSHKNISAHIAAIKFASEMQGHDPDLTPYKRLYRVIRGIRRTQGVRFKKPPRIPITPPLLTYLGTNLWNSSIAFQDKAMLWAAMMTAFYGFLRVSEYTASHQQHYAMKMSQSNLNTSSLFASNPPKQIHLDKAPPYTFTAITQPSALYKP